MKENSVPNFLSITAQPFMERVKIGRPWVIESLDYRFVGFYFKFFLSIFFLSEAPAQQADAGRIFSESRRVTASKIASDMIHQLLEKKILNFQTIFLRISTSDHL